ncbi:MAG: endolytic transglycosylase MltG, partial [Gammaproteobacteria bacterium]|nr:endolytic transglycosylase MltG [Gammaproteobacteria bacterium]
MAGLSGVAVAGAGAWVGAFLAWAERPGPLAESAVLVVEPGRTLEGIARDLEAHAVIDDALRFRWFARLRDAAGAIRAGEYRFEAAASPARVLERLVTGEVVVHRLLILEGSTVRDLLDLAAHAPGLARLLDGATPEDLFARLGLGGGHAEGWFFPDTYHYVRGDTDADVLLRAHRRMRAVLAEAWAGRAPELPYRDEREALIVASIIEKETGMPEHRARIGGVLVRRLTRGMPLQTDPTVIYGLGAAFDGDLTRAHLERDGPYNTYTRRGLPSTPIALPSRAAIEAALHPAPGTALYFVAQGDGATWFSDTLREHNEAVRRFQRALSRGAGGGGGRRHPPPSTPRGRGGAGGPAAKT